MSDLIFLLPCPFCAGKADFNNDGERWHQVICNSCGCRSCEFPDNREKAALSWNTRAPAQPAPDALGQALREASIYGIGATSDVNQRVILEAARAFSVSSTDHKTRSLDVVQGEKEPAPKRTIMDAAASAAETVASWSEAKQDYARRQLDQLSPVLPDVTYSVGNCGALDLIRLGARAMRRAAEADCGNHSESVQEDAMTSGGLTRADKMKLSAEADAAEEIRKQISGTCEDSALGYFSYMGSEEDIAALKALGVTSDWLYRRENGVPSRAEIAKGTVALSSTDHKTQSLDVAQRRQEPDDLAALVDGFAKALLAKLRLAHANGRRGWEKDDWEHDCQQGLLRHLAKGDPRDVAAYCAFMWHHDWITVAEPQPLDLAYASRDQIYEIVLKELETKHPIPTTVLLATRIANALSLSSTPREAGQ